jgi:hypothetical protein
MPKLSHTISRFVVAVATAAVLASPAAAAKLPAGRTFMAEGPLTLEIVDYSPRFLDFYQAAKGADAEARWALWKDRYEFAAVPPTPEGQAIARRLLDNAWDSYAAAVPVIKRGAKAMQPSPMATLKAVAAILNPERPVSVSVLGYVGAFEKNAFTMSQGGKTTVAVPIELAPADREILFPHEMAHAVHLQTAGLSGGWERSIAETVFQEGIAVHVGRLVAPSRSLVDHIEASPGWWAGAQERKRAILASVRPVLAQKDGETVMRFTMGKGPNGIEREAYAAGYWIVEQLQKDGMSLAQIARVPEADMAAMADRAIARLLAE